MYTLIKPICKNCKNHTNNTTCSVNGLVTSPNSVCMFSTMRGVAFSPIITLADIPHICRNCDLHFNNYLCEACGKYTNPDDNCGCVLNGQMSFVPSTVVLETLLTKAKQR